MTPTPRSATRHRYYSLVGLALLIVLAVATLGAFLQVGQEYSERKHYSAPYRVLVLIATKQSRFRQADLDGDGVADYAASLAELERARCITRFLAEEVVLGYRYEVVSRSEGSAAASWGATATPVAGVTSATPAYYVDQTQVVRVSRDGPAGPGSPVFWHPARGFE